MAEAILSFRSFTVSFLLILASRTTYLISSLKRAGTGNTATLIAIKYASISHVSPARSNACPHLLISHNGIDLYSDCNKLYASFDTKTKSLFWISPSFRRVFWYRLLGRVSYMYCSLLIKLKKMGRLSMGPGTFGDSPRAKL